MEPLCPQCHVQVRATDYFCFNCGCNLHPKPPSTTAESQIMLYLGSICLPPMGIIWGWKYVKQPDTKSKIIGYAAIAITVIVIILAVQATMGVVNGVNKQMNQFQGLGL